MVQVAWDTRIQRKVAIKCIPLSEADLRRAAMPGSNVPDGGLIDAAATVQMRPIADAGAPDEAADPGKTAVMQTLARPTTLRPRINPDDVPPWEDLPTEALPSSEVASTTADRRSVQPTSVLVHPDSFAPAAPPIPPVPAQHRAQPTAVLGRPEPAVPTAALGAPAQRPSAPQPSTAVLPAAGESVSLTAPIGSDTAPLVHTLARVPGLDEARTAAMLSDANIVAVYDFEIQDATAYLIMEFVEGMTLTELLRDHGDEMSLDAITAVFMGIAHALEVAHANQVLHLDIKPDNVLIDKQGQVKVTDFGLATLADASGFGTAGGGTIGYMPLEQMRQQALDARCDEWALASVVYEMLVGENPFLAPDLPRAEAAIEDAELVVPSMCWDELGTDADDAVFLALDPDPTERYATVSDFADDLEPLLGNPKRGKRELAALVNAPDEEEPEAEATGELPHPRAPRVPLRDRITPLHRRIAARAVGVCGSALLALVSFANIPQTAGADNPLFWVLLAAVGIVGGVFPHAGALAGCLALSAMLIVQGAPAPGCILLVAASAWWYLLGREGAKEADAALAAPLTGAVGMAQAAPLIAGFCLRPVRAVATSLFSALLTVMLAGLGTGSLLGWDAFGTWQFSANGFPDIGATIWGMLSQPAAWCVIASWPLAAGACAVLRMRPTRPFAALGVAVGAALLFAGDCAAAWLASGQLTWLPSPAALAGTLVPAIVVGAFARLVPEPEYYDEGAQAAEPASDQAPKQANGVE